MVKRLAQKDEAVLPLLFKDKTKEIREVALRCICKQKHVSKTLLFSALTYPEYEQISSDCFKELKLDKLLSGLLNLLNDKNPIIRNVDIFYSWDFLLDIYL